MRFPGFEGEWEEEKLGKDCDVLMCKRVFAHQTSEEGDIPFYKIGTIGDVPDAFISKELFDEYKNKYKYPRKGEVLITCAGTVGKCLVFDGIDSYFQDSNIVWISNPKLLIENSFLYYFVSNVDWSKLNSTTITRLYNDDLRNLKIKFPDNLQEQKKIADLLSIIDQRIQTQSKIIQRLETSMQGLREKLFNRKIKFKDENGKDFPNWEVKPLGKILTIGNGKDYKHLGRGDIPVFGTGGLMTYVDSFLYNGETICIGRKGTIDKPMYYQGKIWTVDTLFYTHSFLYCLPKFIFYIFQSINWIEYNEASGVPSLSKSTIEKIPLLIPSLAEQTLIANFLSFVDEKIEAEKKILEQYKNQKKYLLRNMFV